MKINQWIDSPKIWRAHYAVKKINTTTDKKSKKIPTLIRGEIKWITVLVNAKLQHFESKFLPYEWETNKLSTYIWNMDGVITTWKQISPLCMRGLSNSILDSQYRQYILFNYDPISVTFNLNNLKN